MLMIIVENVVIILHVPDDVELYRMTSICKKTSLWHMSRRNRCCCTSGSNYMIIRVLNKSSSGLLAMV